jgi:hypothetical protein
MNDDQLDELGEIRQLDRDEYEQLRRQIMDCRRKRIARKEQASAGAILASEEAITEQGRELGHKVWEQRKAGRSLRQIAKSLDVSEHILKTCLHEFETRTMMEATRQLEHFRNLDNERLENVMASWLPLACGGPLRVERVRDGVLYSELDYERPAKATFIVLQVIEKRIKLMLASQPEKAVQGETNVMVWLQQVMPQVSQAVRNVEQAPESEASPRRTLVLESSAEQLGE